jgi:catechol 2,3-dioxygenase
MVARLLSQLAHVELVTPKPDESLKFFTDVMGLEETARQGASVYLRGWGSHLHHELALTEGREPALGHIGWRAAGAEELDVAVKRLEAAGAGLDWHDDTPGHGPAYRFRNPGGHSQEVFWETERFRPPTELAPNYPNRPQRYAPRGVAARYLDHVTVTSANIMDNFHWYRDTLGFRFMEWTVLDEHPDMPIFGMLTTCERGHDLGMVADFSAIPGRLHHVSFWLDQIADVLRAADLLLEAGTRLEYGPGRHGMGEQTFLYFREPGGLRLELNSGGYRNYLPDWEPVKWTPAQGSNDFYRHNVSPPSMMESFPPDRPSDERANPWAAGRAA